MRSPTPLLLLLPFSPTTSSPICSICPTAVTIYLPTFPPQSPLEDISALFEFFPETATVDAESTIDASSTIATPSTVHANGSMNVWIHGATTGHLSTSTDLYTNVTFTYPLSPVECHLLHHLYPSHSHFAATVAVYTRGASLPMHTTTLSPIVSLPPYTSDAFPTLPTVNFDHRPPPTHTFSSLTSASLDGREFPIAIPTATGRPNPDELNNTLIHMLSAECYSLTPTPSCSRLTPDPDLLVTALALLASHTSHNTLRQAIHNLTIQTHLATDTPLHLIIGATTDHLNQYQAELSHPHTHTRPVPTTPTLLNLTCLATHPPPSSTHALTLEHVLEHLPLPSALLALQNLHQTLSPTGTLTLAVPDRNSYAASPSTMAYNDVRDRHTTQHTAATLTTLLHLADYTTTRLEYHTPQGVLEVESGGDGRWRDFITRRYPERVGEGASLITRSTHANPATCGLRRKGAASGLLARLAEYPALEEMYMGRAHAAAALWNEVGERVDGFDVLPHVYGLMHTEENRDMLEGLYLKMLVDKGQDGEAARFRGVARRASEDCRGAVPQTVTVTASTTVVKHDHKCTKSKHGMPGVVTCVQVYGGRDEVVYEGCADRVEVGAAASSVNSTYYDMGGNVIGGDSYANRGQTKTMRLTVFTLMLDGEPYIRHHYEVIRKAAEQLHVPFTWVIVEGVAAGRADYRRPYSDENISAGEDNLSRDGSSSYVDELVRSSDGRVVVERVSPGTFRDKLEMVNVAMEKYNGDGVLFQIDCDEIWSADGIVRAFKAVVDDKRACLKVRCSFFVGEGRTIAFNGGWGDGPGEWLRVWRSYPGDYFASHAPPVLVTTRDNQLQSVAVDHSECADKDEMWEKGIFFDHYAYVREEQVQFKAKFYGYGAEAVEGWRRLQTATLPARANGYLKWLNEGEKNYEPRFDDTTVVQMLGEKIEVKNWPATVPCRHTIVIDCVTFQVNDGGGIARVWKEALPRLVEKGANDDTCFVLVERGRSAVFDGVKSAISAPHVKVVTAPLYNSNADFERDEAWLSTAVNDNGGDVFVSTQHTMPNALLSPTVKTVVLLHDLTPEIYEWGWLVKKRVVERATEIVGVSETTIEKYYEHYGKREGVRAVASRNGVDTSVFYRRERGEGEQFLIVVGNRGGYKSGHTLFLTLKAMCAKSDSICPELVLVGGGDVTAEERERFAGVSVRQVGNVSDESLAGLYSNAFALVFLSLDEGFGLPVAEAMACGCQLILSDISVFREVVGRGYAAGGVQFVNPGSMDEISAAIITAASERGQQRGGLVAESRARFGAGWEVLSGHLWEALRRKE